MCDNQRKRKMKKNILFALISLCFWGCSEDEIKPYHGGQYLYFSQLKEFGDEDFEVSFNNYPTTVSYTISEPTRRTPISYAVFCLKKKTYLIQILILWRTHQATRSCTFFPLNTRNHYTCIITLCLIDLLT